MPGSTSVLRLKDGFLIFSGPLGGINASGYVVGNALEVAICCGIKFGVIVTPTGYTSLGLDNGGLAINDLGQAAGYSSRNAFVTSTSGTLIVPLIPAWSSMQARAINNSGLIAGVGINSTGQGQAFVGTAGSVTGIPTPQGLNFGSAEAINSSGIVAGYFCASSSANRCQAFTYSSGVVTMIPLPVGASSASTAAQSINDSQSVVGWSDAGGWIWSPSTGTQIIQNLTAGTGGSFIIEARSISNSGRILARTGSGVTSYIELTPLNCTYTLSQASQSFQAAGGTLSVAVTAPSSCSWSVSGLPGWITTSGNPSGTGSGTLTLNVAPNTGGARSAALAVGGVSLNITQADSTSPSVSPGGVTPIYSKVPAITAGSWASVSGTNLAAMSASWAGDFPTSIAGTSVAVNGRLAYLSYVSPTQINFQAPTDTATGTVPVLVTSPTGSYSSTVTLAQTSPSFALLDASHVAAIIPRTDGSGAYGGGTYDVVGPGGISLGYKTVPVRAGEVVELFGVGFGQTNPPVLAGKAFSGAAPTTNPVTVLVSKHHINPTVRTGCLRGIVGM